jgi:hypothetical protein
MAFDGANADVLVDTGDWGGFGMKVLDSDYAGEARRVVTNNVGNSGHNWHTCYVNIA